MSETTFVLPPEDPAASYRVRIFTPRAELPFAGHPTLGTAHAVLEAGRVTPIEGRLVQQCAVGLVEVSIDEAMRSFRLPRYASSPAPDADRLAAAVGGSDLVDAPQVLDVGPRWVIGQVTSAQALSALAPDLAALADYDRAQKTTGLTLFAITQEGINVRSFAPADGIAEDPVCGSGNGAVAAYRLLKGQIGDGDTYLASQGREVGRDGQVHIRIAGADVHVGGACVTCVTGSLSI
ncbi:MAG: PhzF family phenazine biosynthesis protein [Betaproteobacteria bacterium]|nr:PhzF family phenazine biosynthesis protein [Betaproteobacteria bacterium]